MEVDRTTGSHSNTSDGLSHGLSDELNNVPSEKSTSNAAAGDVQENKSSLNSFQVVGSVFAAGLGVQSSKNRERDFKQGRAGTFIVAGLLFTALFIGTVYTIVSLVLSSR